MLAAVIGDPVRHSLSPAIHNAGFAALGLDWVYVALPVPAGRGREAVAAMAVLGIGGLSVTMPHKGDVAAAVDVRTPAVEALGFCNCVFRDGDRLVGDNTDGDGLVRSLAVEGVDVAGARTLVVGTGGAASSIVEALGRHGAAEVIVTSRDPARAAERARVSEGARPGRLDEAADVDIVVNASPLGMAGGPDPDGIPIDSERIGAGQVVVDIVYEPRVTPLLAAARDRGATVIGGVGMLIHQAALAFERWTGEPAPVAEMAAAATLNRSAHEK